MNKKILHLAFLDKFIPGFVDIIDEHFPKEEHTIFSIGDIKKYPYKKSLNSIHLPTIKNIKGLCSLILELHRSDKVILHGLSSIHITILLCFMPWLHKKLNWVIWGGDLYYHQLATKNLKFKFVECFRKRLISRLGGFVTYVDGDYDKVQQWYGATGVLYECIMYKSNVYYGPLLCESITNTSESRGKSEVNIQVGNSADPTNNHEEVFYKLLKLDAMAKVGKIYCPLSYGNVNYAKKINELGTGLFGEKFHPLMDFISLDEYNKVLDDVDIAIFAHKRQQAMGNIINLLGRGKTVYVREDTSSYALLKKLRVNILPLSELSLSVQSCEESFFNNKIIFDYFNEDNLVNQLKKIFA
ncbi:TDP-N-acetylfucosamine:lipid II N-acetylfucosaminyltransferase [Vibrio parahaemolyticus]|uniref:TDP-N-acetylfucosamine:lipid II N-acetylfucosaminyltransferase n=1 Tax=Vibrio parahaemolyticus TaxID=670 RepID=UPI0009B5E8FC|nr:TDP-N-acetylfucosamine:lipid II N-acetylfucosaminyltransferase [Vibrio parahaemolyticus]EHJ9992223.1 TDP-N-acetylfucosamine:lipid II N-acetylfucosaminyltransferase [Vibrio parahaemolyticus]MCG0008410.1 TDP-N-acetylfucosamine:lipid II N-acetylfucosaminyltransferase [Vibrio parahaemolyticus]MCG0013175.1 TDP-N-acetylfucosamine:lipid II N-acetylfucosaminyltransferase [Vibrio parahaemolyticus]MDL1999106.1 TDP-N-acetylfucosamine:lipid II N-acetylfucosaminyltransferase [Vibrio parahaemolyticus]MDL